MRAIVTCLAVLIGPCCAGNTAPNECPEGQRDITTKDPTSVACVDERAK